MKDYQYRGYDIWEERPGAWIIAQKGKMRVPGKLFVSETMLKMLIKEEGGLQQVINVAMLPGIVKYSIAMPDIHWGYGFPIGGVAAMDMDNGVISPGGVGYDINCGVRLIRTDMSAKEIKPKLKTFVDTLYRTVPTGVGSEGAVAGLKQKDIRKILELGAAWAIERGYGADEDLQYTESKGRIEEANPDAVSERAIQRGLKQVGTLGSGNHFLEIQEVEKVYASDIAGAFGVFEGQMVIMIHSGSRGLGHQVCDDYIHTFKRSISRYHIDIPDPQLICAPIDSPEGRDYLGAMYAAANYAWNNRQVMTHFALDALENVVGLKREHVGARLVYDVCHNIAKVETHSIDGQKKKVCVHRKGATRAFPAGHEELPRMYRAYGQPVIIPGDMGRYSYLAVGMPEAMEESFGSSCHGAGRLMSRHKALKAGQKKDLFREMERMGVWVQARGRRTVAEEMPYAYKDVADVVEVIEKNNISRKVAKLKPIGVIKG